jgi:hypothetical protein
MKHLILAGALVLAVAPASFAQETSYYIVRDAATKKCTVVHEKPTTTTTTIVDGNKVYKTETEAQSAMKTTKVCTED